MSDDRATVASILQSIGKLTHSERDELYHELQWKVFDPTPIVVPMHNRKPDGPIWIEFNADYLYRVLAILANEMFEAVNDAIKGYQHFQECGLHLDDLEAQAKVDPDFVDLGAIMRTINSGRGTLLLRLYERISVLQQYAERANPKQMQLQRKRRQARKSEAEKNRQARIKSELERILNFIAESSEPVTTKRIRKETHVGLKVAEKRIQTLLNEGQIKRVPVKIKSSKESFDGYVLREPKPV